MKHYLADVPQEVVQAHFNKRLVKSHMAFKLIFDKLFDAKIAICFLPS